MKKTKLNSFQINLINEIQHKLHSALFSGYCWINVPKYKDFSLLNPDTKNRPHSYRTILDKIYKAGHLHRKDMFNVEMVKDYDGRMVNKNRGRSSSTLEMLKTANLVKTDKNGYYLTDIGKCYVEEIMHKI